MTAQAPVIGPTVSAPQTYAQKPARTYPANNYTNEQLVAMANAVFKRCNDAIFTKCGWNGHGGFTNPAAILDPIRIDDIVPADFVMEAEGVDANGRWNEHIPCGTVIRGQVFRNTGLPGFKIHMNARGTDLVRVILPQNLNKPSRSAADAKAGNRIIWVMRDNDPTNKWVGSFTNDVWKAN
jgi:hypothetical protein